jgi:phospholipid transport system substrate-binding protein
LYKLGSILLFLMLSLSSGMSFAVEAPDLIQDSLEQLNQVITQRRGDYAQDPQRAYAEVGAVLTNIFDFDAFSVGVMGKKNAASNPELSKVFTQVLKLSLVKIFTDGLMSLGPYTVELDSPAQSKPDRAKVQMKVATDSGATHALTYSLALGEQWQIRNVTFDGVNLGLTLRSQFANLVSTLGSLEQAVTDWKIDDSQ